MAFEIVIRCAFCGYDLKVNHGSTEIVGNGMVLEVDPCNTCEVKHYELGKQEALAAKQVKPLSECIGWIFGGYDVP